MGGEHLYPSTGFLGKQSFLLHHPLPFLVLTSYSTMASGAVSPPSESSVFQGSSMMGLAISIKDGSQRSVHISAERDLDLHLSTNLLGTARDSTPP